METYNLYRIKDGHESLVETIRKFPDGYYHILGTWERSKYKQVLIKAIQRQFPEPLIIRKEN